MIGSTNWPRDRSSEIVRPVRRTITLMLLWGRDLMPNQKRMSVSGHRGLARGQMPSFTNVNHTSIVTRVPPSKHGIGGITSMIP